MPHAILGAQTPEELRRSPRCRVRHFSATSEGGCGLRPGAPDVVLRVREDQDAAERLALVEPARLRRARRLAPQVAPRVVRPGARRRCGGRSGSAARVAAAPGQHRAAWGRWPGLERELHEPSQRSGAAPPSHCVRKTLSGPRVRRPHPVPWRQIKDGVGRTSPSKCGGTEAGSRPVAYGGGTEWDGLGSSVPGPVPWRRGPEQLQVGRARPLAYGGGTQWDGLGSSVPGPVPWRRGPE